MARRSARVSWRGLAAAALVVVLAFAALPARAQDAEGILLPPAGEADAVSPRALTPADSLDPMLPAAAAPFAAPDQMTPSAAPDLRLGPAEAASPRLLLSARLTADGPAVQSGVVWRVFGNRPGLDGALPLVAEATGGTVSFELAPDVYHVFCGFGETSATTRVVVTGALTEESIVLGAGGLRMTAHAETNEPLPDADIRFDIYSMQVDAQGEKKVVVSDVPPGEILRLAEATYHVVSRYGDVNASTRGDVEVKAGKLIDVTLFQRAARVTLKLVGEPGGEAIADTRWSVITPGGDIVTEAVGAFPSFVLASGEYTVVARHDERTYQRGFHVETGRDSEVEVVAGE